MQSAQAWADQTFGDADLGDARRTRRLVKVASGVCLRPAGRLTRVYADSAEREGAFRLIENDAVSASAIARASHRATARRCAGESMVYVALDSTALVVVDKQKRKFGRLGSVGTTHRGILAMNGLAVDRNGTTLGTTALEYWVRGEERCPRWSSDERAPEERESSLWKRAIDSTLQVMRGLSPQCTPWFQMDRGADFADVLVAAQQQSLLVTVRATYDRTTEFRRKSAPLWQQMQARRVLGHMAVRLPARQGRPARIARLSLRAQRLGFRVAQEKRQRPRHPLEMTAVYVKEVGRQDGIEWMLWTTYPVESARDAHDVVDGYIMRWRVEDFHRSWKRGGCDIESSQLRSVSALQRWGAITAAVAARAEHLKLLSRSEPDRDAEQELTRDEIDAAIILSHTKRHRIGDKLTLEQAVTLIACAGGYTGKSSGGPPGAQTIARGLRDLATATVVLSAARSG